MRCTQKELDAFVAIALDDFGDRAEPIDLEHAEGYESVMVDLFFPDIPYGFSTDEFMESWNRQLKTRE